MVYCLTPDVGAAGTAVSGTGALVGITAVGLSGLVGDGGNVGVGETAVASTETATAGAGVISGCRTQPNNTSKETAKEEPIASNFPKERRSLQAKAVFTSPNKQAKNCYYLKIKDNFYGIFD